MIIWRGQPLANDHLEGLAYCKISSGWTGFSQIIIYHPRHPSHLCQDPDSILRTLFEQFVLVAYVPLQRPGLFDKRICGKENSQTIIYLPFSFASVTANLLEKGNFLRPSGG